MHAALERAPDPSWNPAHHARTPRHACWIGRGKQRLVEAARKRVLVGARIDDAALGLLWRHVARGPDDTTGLSDRAEQRRAARADGKRAADGSQPDQPEIRD